MSKPDWKDAPEWAQWLAQSGSPTFIWTWFQDKPTRYIHGWSASEGSDFLLGTYGGVNTKWQLTLERRP